MSSKQHSRGLIPCYRPTFNASDLLTALVPVGGRNDFESEFTARVGARFGLTFAYGRLGFFTTLKALGLRDAEVILPAFTCPTMAGAVVASGNRPVFVDINPDDYSMDLTALTRALSRRTRAVVVTHLYGYYSDVQKVREMVQDDRITILEDCAHRVPPGPASTTGLTADVAIFSLGTNKAMSAIRGGVVGTNSAALYERIKTERDQRSKRVSARAGAKLWLWWLASYVVYHRWIYGLWQRQRSAVPRRIQEAVWRRDAEQHMDENMSFANFQARLGRSQMARLDAVVARRRQLAQAYNRELRSIPEVRTAPLREDATYTFYTVRVPHRGERHFEERMKTNGVVVGRTFDFILPELKPYRNLSKGDYSEALQAARQVVNLPIHPALGETDVRHIVECVRRSLDSARSAG